MSFIKRFLRREDGPTASEYAIMLGLIVIIAITSIELVGGNSDQTYKTVKEVLKEEKRGKGGGQGGNNTW